MNFRSKDHTLDRTVKIDIVSANIQSKIQSPYNLGIEKRSSKINSSGHEGKNIFSILSSGNNVVMKAAQGLKPIRFIHVVASLGTY